MACDESAAKELKAEGLIGKIARLLVEKEDEEGEALESEKEKDTALERALVEKKDESDVVVSSQQQQGKGKSRR